LTFGVIHAADVPLNPEGSGRTREATHYLWRLGRLESELLGERRAILKAIETMAGLKKAYRKELADRREIANAKVRERFAAREGIAA
jgi:hypothetical protein